MTKAFWFTLGLFFTGTAFIGVIVPGIPWSTPTVLAAYCFARSSDRMHRWLYSHPRFGPFLTGWKTKRIFPQKLKYVMLITMSTTLLITWFATGNGPAVAWTGLFMLAVAVWGFRYPSTEEEWQYRKDNGKKIAWLR
jgi:uncharacterized membrane protein YbaN (DUF454 family)